MPGHDHGPCAARALAEAEELCTQRGARLTDLRRRVLERVWASHVPVGAYDILAQLNADGGRIAPMAVYRALEFLMDNGLVHRLDSRNAYIGCVHPGETHRAQFLICETCGAVAELASRALADGVRRAALAKGFRVDSVMIEASGRCPNCSSAP
jgi:Fur family zinc uptake transcriptional regulator